MHSPCCFAKSWLTDVAPITFIELNFDGKNINFLRNKTKTWYKRSDFDSRPITSGCTIGNLQGTRINSDDALSRITDETSPISHNAIIEIILYILQSRYSTCGRQFFKLRKVIWIFDRFLENFLQDWRMGLTISGERINVQLSSCNNERLGPEIALSIGPLIASVLVRAIRCREGNIFCSSNFKDHGFIVFADDIMGGTYFKLKREA